MWKITTKGVSGSSLTVTAEQQGEMLDRVRYAMESAYIESVTVTRDEGEQKCNHNCAPNYTNLNPNAEHYLDCPIWKFNS